MARCHVLAIGADEAPKAAVSRAVMSWVQRLRWVYDIDVSVCLKCGGALNVLVVVTDPVVSASIFVHIAKRVARALPERNFTHVTPKQGTSGAAIGLAAGG